VFVPTATVPVPTGIALVATDGVIPVVATEAVVLFVGLVVIVGVTVPTQPFCSVTVPVQVKVTETTTAEPTVGVVVAPAALLTTTHACVAACAGTTDKSPNPSEATATADTFFNEIVFTIFLSFSRFQAFPGLGWWLKRPPH
jgi:hypothetical protein